MKYSSLRWSLCRDWAKLNSPHLFSQLTLQSLAVCASLLNAELILVPIQLNSIAGVRL